MLWLLVGYVVAQDVTVINRFEGDSGSTNIEDYVLRGVSERTVVVNRFERVDNNPANRVRDLIEYSLRSYLETAYFIEDGKVVAKKQPQKVATDMKAVVRNALWLFEYDFADDFPGFSTSLVNDLKELRQWNGYSVSFGHKKPGKKPGSKVGFFYFQKLGLDAKEQAMEEVENFLKPRLGERQADGYLSTGSPGQPDNNGEEGVPQFLKPRDFVLQPVKNHNEELSLNGSGGEAAKDTAFTDEYGARIVRLLEKNNQILAHYDRRFDNLQGQIDELKQKGPDPELRKEVRELRRMVENLRNGQVVEDSTGNRTKKLDLASQKVSFNKNEYKLDWNHRARLNRVKEILVKHPAYKLLITGYADKSGKSQYNVYLSKQRALSVKHYLVAQGIEPKRLVVNFYGDTQSDEVGPQDRKVVLEWLTDLSALAEP